GCCYQLALDFRCFFVVACLVDFFFFFQAEDGIRDLTVTGVQTCALPISGPRANPVARSAARAGRARRGRRARAAGCRSTRTGRRSEERRVGKECRSRWSPDHVKKKREKSRANKTAESEADKSCESEEVRS